MSGVEGMETRRGAETKVGRVIGRYVVLGELGRGGMGRVLKAYDESLDRIVALKLLHSGTSDRDAERLRREAQALARLSHPNVVHVYEVGKAEGQWFIAMEMVQGQTLRRWQQRKARGWKECARAYLQAGEGLVAAHQEGLVHRDFKPDNCIIDEQGRTKVLDFGLVRETSPSANSGNTTDDRLPEPCDVVVARKHGGSLTRTGAILGTIGYMPLEQLEGKPTDARSDQFGFCVSLWEALFGHRPFAGASAGQLMISLASGEIRSVPRGTRVPATLQRVLRRGLSTKPDDRWPSMDILLTELRRALMPRRRGLVLLIGLGAVAIVALRSKEGIEAPPPCEGAKVKLHGVWDEPRREAVSKAFLATNMAYAADAYEEVERTLDAYSNKWVRLHTATCEATRVRNDQSEFLMDLRIGCLDERRRDLAELTTVLAEDVDATVVEKSVLGLQQLPSLEECITLEREDSHLLGPDDPAELPEVERARELIAKARASSWSGKYQEGLRLAEAAVDTAEATGFTPVIAEAYGVLGDLSSRMMKVEPTRGAYEEALYAALASGHARIQIEALIGLSSVKGVHLMETEDALHYARQAEALANFLGDPPKYLGAIALYRGNTLMAANLFDEAITQLRLAVEITRDEPEAEQIHLAALNNVAAALGQQGRYGDAAEAFIETLAVSEERLGPWHPMVGSTHNNLGVTYSRIEEFEVGSKHARRAIEIYEEVLGPSHAELGRGYHNLGVLQADQGDFQGAYISYRKALEVKKRALGPDHVTVAFSSNNLGDSLRRLGRPREAIPLLEEALRIWTGALGPNHPNNIYALDGLAQAHLALERADLALPHARRALELSESGDIDPVEKAKAEFVTARAMLDTGGNLEDAIMLGERALADYRSSERPSPREIAEIEQWLAGVGDPPPVGTGPPSLPSR